MADASRDVPQWGKSFQQAMPAAATDQQLVRVKLARAVDVTVYLDGLLISDNGTYLGPVSTYYSVNIGSGGVSLEQSQIYVPAVGVARHYVTDVVNVNVSLQSMNLASGGFRRVAATCSLGRPSVSYRIADAVLSPLVAALPQITPNAWTVPAVRVGWTQVGSANNNYYRVPSFATRMKIQCASFTGGATAANILVREVDWTNNVYPTFNPSPSPIGVQRTAADYADFQPLTPQAAYIQLTADPAMTAYVLITFERIL